MALFQVQQTEEDKKYTKKVNVPQYLPKNIKPDIDSLCNSTKTNELVNEILKSNVSEKEKEFLIKAAQRHLSFHYANIADYYAHSDKEMQELMEKSALVIIDFNDAIANGYVELSSDLRKIREQDRAENKETSDND